MSAPMPRHLAPAESRRQVRVFMCTNFVYVWLVFGWSLTLYPLGIDFVHLADSSQLQPAVRAVWEMELRVFGEHLWMYRVFNILLLYCCMVSILFLSRFVLNGAWWLGSLAAVLTMANPAKSEGVLHLSAVADLLPAFAALSALAAWAWWHRHGGWAPYGLALVLGTFASLQFMENMMVPWIMLALYTMVSSEHRAKAWQLVPVSLLGVAAMAQHMWIFKERVPNLIDALTPLYLAFYPLGLWPQTAVFYLQYPWVWLVLWVLFFAVVGLVSWRIKEGAISFAIVAAILMRAVPMGAFDLVHLRGGGALIVPMAMIYLAMSAVWMHIQRHPRWRRQAVMLTTLLCLAFFAMQWQALWHWRQAAAVVKAFQARAELSVEESGGDPVAIAPDFRYHYTAPVALYASVLTDTPWSRELPVTSAFAMHYFRPPKGDVTVVEWGQFGGVLEVNGCTVEEALGPDTHAMQAGDSIDYELFQVTLEERRHDGFRLKTQPLGDFLPERIIPLRNRGKALALSVDDTP